LVETQLFSEDEVSYGFSPVKNIERLLRFLGDFFYEMENIMEGKKRFKRRW
jgi:hypothetical protein